jgi:general secretion pathway protein B
MSTILDALRKSELARRAGRAPVYRDAAPSSTPPLLRWLSLLAVLTLMAALGVSVWLITRPAAGIAIESSGTPPGPSASASRPEPPATKTVAAAVSPPAADLSGQVSARRTTPAVGREARPEAAAAVPAVSAPSPGQEHGEAPWLASLPAAFRERLPALVVNIHVYAPDEAQRILYINNRPVRRGEQIPGGVVVEEILPEGVLLRAHGQRFRLPRPT